MTFELSASELNICFSNAFKKKYSHISKHKMDIENIVIGNIGEMAYSKYSGLPMDLTINETVKGDGGIDFPDHTQVKTVTWTGPNKMIKIRKADLQKYIDVGIEKIVLAAVNVKDITKVVLVGKISLTDFISNMILDERFGSCYVVEEKHLQPIT